MHLRSFFTLLFLLATNTAYCASTEIAWFCAHTKIESAEMINFNRLLETIYKNPVGIILINEINKLLAIESCQLQIEEIKNPEQFNRINFEPPTGFSNKATIKFTMLDVPLTVITSGNKTELVPTPPDVVLFHELLHFAHFLLNKKRALREICINGVGDLLYMDSCASATFFSHELFKDFPVSIRLLKAFDQKLYDKHCEQWANGEKFAAKTKIPSIMSNVSFPSTIFVIKVEEFRTIIGSDPAATHPLDVISENAYRFVQDLPLRYGNKLIPCQLDEDLVEWVASRAAKYRMLGAGG